MTDLPLAFIGGLLGSAHCVGMCGPLAVLVSAEARPMSRAVRRHGSLVRRVVTRRQPGFFDPCWSRLSPRSRRRC